MNKPATFARSDTARMSNSLHSVQKRKRDGRLREAEVLAHFTSWLPQNNNCIGIQDTKSRQVERALMSNQDMSNACFSKDTGLGSVVGWPTVGHY